MFFPGVRSYQVQLPLTAVLLWGLVGLSSIAAAQESAPAGPPLVEGAAAPPLDIMSRPFSELGSTIDVYAKANGVTRGEAVRRFARIQAAIRLAERLESQERGNFAGLEITHGANFRITTRFKDDPVGSFRRHGRGFGLDLDKETISESSAYSLQDLITAKARIDEIARTANLDAIVQLAGRGGLDIVVLDRVAFDAALLSAGYALPDYARVVVRPRLFEDKSLVTAGNQITLRDQAVQYTCTSGFAIRERATSAIGFATAGHCRNTAVSAVGVSPDAANLLFSDARGERLTNGMDFQWHAVSPPHAVSASINTYGGSFPRIYSYSPTSSFRTNMPVTVLGATTKRPMSAYLVSTLGYALSGFGCCFYHLKPTYYDDILVASGDSGGVVYSGNTAVGIIKSDTGLNLNDMYFMPIQAVVNAGYDIIAATN